MLRLYYSNPHPPPASLSLYFTFREKPKLREVFAVLFLQIQMWDIMLYLLQSRAMSLLRIWWRKLSTADIVIDCDLKKNASSSGLWLFMSINKMLVYNNAFILLWVSLPEEKYKLKTISWKCWFKGSSDISCSYNRDWLETIKRKHYFAWRNTSG